MRDRLTWTCAAWWVLAMTACVFSAQPAHALGMIACVLAFAGGGMLLAGRTRGVFLCAIASAAAYGGTYLGLSRVMARVEVEILVHMMGLPGVSCCNDVHTFSAENVARVGLGLSIGVGVWLFSVFVATLVLTRLRRILLERSGTEVRLGDV